MSELPTEPENRQRLTFPDVVREVFTNFEAFAADHLTGARPPQFFIAIWLIGMDAVAGGIDLEYLRTSSYGVDNWFHAWLRIMGGGILAGAARYWIVGSLFHLLVRAAGGSGPARLSRYLFLYAAFPVAVAALTVKVVDMVVYGNRYFTGQTNAAFDGALSGVMLVTYGFALLLCYRGMLVLHHTEKKRSAAVLAAMMLGMLAVLVAVGA